VTLDTSHALMSELKAYAALNMFPMVVTSPTSHLERLRLNGLQSHRPPNILYMSVTLPTFQSARSLAVKLEAELNMFRMLVTLDVSHREMSWLNELFSLNRLSMFVTCDTSQSGMSTAQAGPQFARPDEQQFSPEGSTSRHRSTADLSEAKLVKGLATVSVQGVDTPRCHASGGPSYIPEDSSYVLVHTLVSHRRTRSS